MIDKFGIIREDVTPAEDVRETQVKKASGEPLVELAEGHPASRLARKATKKKEDTLPQKP